jgi:hypothetical protein
VLFSAATGLIMPTTSGCTRDGFVAGGLTQNVLIGTTDTAALRTSSLTA